MELSSILVGVLLALFVALMISYMVLQTARPNVANVLSPKLGSLGMPTKIGNINDVRDNFMTSASGTLMLYVYATLNNKTPSLGNKQEPVNLFALGNSVMFQILPGGVSSNTSARLMVRTQKPSSEVNYEEIPIPRFPEQTWVHVAIVREGRRYTIYYNGEAMSSGRTQFYPFINSSQFIAGDSRLFGEFALPRIAPVAYRLEEIQYDLAQTSDTRHVPYTPMSFWKSLTSMGTLGCPKGLFCFSTSSPPSSNPLKMWQTPYA
jgi:hypothetical protein